MIVELIAQSGNPISIMNAAAKGCYSKDSSYELLYEFNSNGDIARKFIESIIDSGHESVLEHASFTFSIEGMSRACSHQLVRHRIASYSQQSQRYVEFDITNENAFVIPPEIKKDIDLKEAFIYQCQRSIMAYNTLVQTLIAKGRTNEEAYEDARYILPNACKTNITMTMNLREIRHFISQRTCNRAQWEIKELANHIFNLLDTIDSTLLYKCGPPCKFGTCPEGSRSCGHPYKK